MSNPKKTPTSKKGTSAKTNNSPLLKILLLVVLAALVIYIFVGVQTSPDASGDSGMLSGYCGDGLCSDDEGPEICPLDCGQTVTVDGGSLLVAEEELTFGDCEYDGQDTLTCATNCEDSGIVVLVVSNNLENKTAQAIGGIYGDGSLVFSNGYVAATPVHSEDDGAESYALSELGEPSSWVVFFSCGTPDGEKLIIGLN